VDKSVKTIINILTIAISFSYFAYAKDIFLPLVQDIKYDKAKVKLGKKIFFDNNLSRNRAISCASCHFNYGADTEAISVGTDRKKLSLNTPSNFNLQYHIGYNWNGRADSIKSQAKGPLFSSSEMNMTQKLLLQRLNDDKEYKKLFVKAYRQKPNIDDTLDALARFQETLITPNAKFDRYLRGETKLTKSEARGLALFKSYGCVVCHNGINLGSNSYQKFGNVIDVDIEEYRVIKDRYAFTKDESDRLVYKVPSLRNVAKTAPYFHTGTIDSLAVAIEMMGYFNLGVVLDKKDISDIEAFLHTLTGELPKTLTGEIK
jgi:cytochrome c peroxidase